MIQLVYERTARARVLQRVVVATDDERIGRTVESFGGEWVLTDAHHESGTDRIAQAARILDLEQGDLILNVQGDEPLVSAVMLEVLAGALEQRPDAAMATLAFASRDLRDFQDGNVVKVVVGLDDCALYFSRAPVPFVRDASMASTTFLKHLGFYAYRNSFLQTFTALPQGRLEALEKLEQLRALEHGHRIVVALSPRETHGVDTPEDLARIEAQWDEHGL